MSAGLRGAAALGRERTASVGEITLPAQVGVPAVVVRLGQDDQHARIEESLRILRESHPLIETLFTCGGCVELARSLAVAHGGDVWWSWRLSHAWARVAGRWYDIRGARDECPDGAVVCSAEKLTELADCARGRHLSHELASTLARGKDDVSRHLRGAMARRARDHDWIGEWERGLAR